MSGFKMKRVELKRSYGRKSYYLVVNDDGHPWAGAGFKDQDLKSAVEYGKHLDICRDFERGKAKVIICGDNKEGADS